jgi:peptide chain release factor 1
MQTSIRKKLEQLDERLQELNSLLAASDVLSSKNNYVNLSKEYSELEPVVMVFRQYLKIEENFIALQLLAEDKDHEIKKMALEEIMLCNTNMLELEKELSILLLPKDPNDQCNVFLEVRAGTGGDEASIFSGDLLRMYLRYAEKMNWQYELISESHGEHGGYKEVIVRLIGNNVYSSLKFESGAHRVQRVPATESQGRIHTSACTIAVMPEVPLQGDVQLESKDLRIDTYRASGAGGQHVNKTDSAVRITHIPTGVVVECQDERSQHKNKAKALSLLTAKISEAEKAKQRQEQAQTRRDLVGSGARSERIRTYNYPQGRITDHRINLTVYKLDDVMEGELDVIIQPLRQEHQADLLASMANEQ